MPPTFRSSRSGRQFGEGANRTRTGQIDHDVFEGLPVRRWTRQVQTISQEAKTEGVDTTLPGPGGKQTPPEHPMPRDSHLLTPMSRALLRAARAGCIYIRQASKDEEDDEKEVTDVEEAQLAPSTERSFTMRKWSTVPKHLETPEVEFLAKRRPGLISLYGATAGTVDGANGSAPMRKTRFKKVDPVTGNISIYAAWVPEGHKIEGEVADDAQVIAENSKVTVTPQVPAPGTVIEGVGVVNAQGVVVAEAGSVSVITPPKRRPPPPKRKAKGFGKGRRKKVMFAPGDGADASLVHGAGEGGADGAAGYAKDSDPSQLSADQTAQDDEEDDGDEGEESDDGEGDESGFDAKTPETPGPQPSTEPEAEQTPGPADVPTPTPIPIATETVNETPAPPVPEASSALVLEPPSKEPTPRDLANSASPEKNSDSPIVAPVKDDDVEMTDAALPMPPFSAENSTISSSLPVSDTQQESVAGVAKPTPAQKAQSPPQENPQASAPESSEGQVESKEKPGTEEPIQAMDITMEEPSEQVSEPVDSEVAKIEASAETKSQSPVLEEVPKDEPIPEQHEQHEQHESQPNSGNESDLLGILEASLGDKPNVTQTDEQKKVEAEQQPEPHATEDAPTEVGPAEPTVTEKAEETKELSPDQPVPPVEALTPPEPEQKPQPNPEQSEEAPDEKQAARPSSEDQASEESIQQQTLPSENPAGKDAQTTPEEPEEAPPKDSVPQEVAEDAPAQPAEPPIEPQPTEPPTTQSDEQGPPPADDAVQSPSEHQEQPNKPAEEASSSTPTPADDPETE